MSTLTLPFRDIKLNESYFMFSAGLRPVPIYGLFAACAFGILNKELMLTKLVLKELETFGHDEEHIHHIAFFNSYYQILQVGICCTSIL